MVKGHEMLAMVAAAIARLGTAVALSSSYR